MKCARKNARKAGPESKENVLNYISITQENVLNHISLTQENVLNDISMM